MPRPPRSPRSCERFEQKAPLEETPPDTAWRRARHWARSEPALAARLAVIVACSAIMWGYRLVFPRYSPLLASHWARSSPLTMLGPVESVLVWMNQAILAAWGLASWAFQRRLTRERRDGGLQLGWRLVDVAALCLLIELDDALMSPLTVAFAVLIVASAFWARADQILQTTLLSMAGYVLLALVLPRPPSRPRPSLSSLPLPGRAGLRRPDADLPGEPHPRPGPDLRCAWAVLVLRL